MSELRKLPDSKVFSRDPETWDSESLFDATLRLAKVVERLKRVAVAKGVDKLAVEPHIQLVLSLDEGLDLLDVGAKLS